MATFVAAPPRSVMNSRLFIRSPRRRARAACLEFGGRAVNTDSFFLTRRNQLAALEALRNSHDPRFAGVHRSRRSDELWNKRCGLPLTQACEGQVDVLFGTSTQDNELLPEASGRSL